MSSIVVNDTIIAVARGLHIDCFDRSNHNVTKVDSKEMNDNICDIIIATNHQHLAAITSASKQLIIYDLPLLKKVKSYILPRGASKIRFSVDDNSIYVADKTGDVLVYDITKEDNGIKLLGHLSLLLNVLQTNDCKFIISSDRDEKIRVSCYPNTYNIQTYCLGHKEFVNNLELLPHNDKYLTSTSGDGTIKCWDYINGKLCYSIDTFLDINDKTLKENYVKVMIEQGIEVDSMPIVNYTITKGDKSCSLLAVTVYGLNTILLYSLATDSINGFQHKLLQKLDVDLYPTALQFNNLSLFIYNNNINTVNEYLLKYEKLNLSLEHVTTTKMFDNIEDINNLDLENNENSIKVLYKRKFDNVQEYQERKKQRLGKV